MPLNASQQPQNTYGATVAQTQPFLFPTISPSLNGAVLGDIEATDKPRLAIRAAIDEARAAAETALANVRAIHGNPEWPDGRKHVESNVAATRVVEPMLATLDKAIAGLNARVEDVRKVTAPPAPPTDLAGTVLAGEIRAKLSNMAPDDRMKTLLRSIGDGDETTIAAALGGPAFLTGLGALDLERLGTAWQKKHFAAELDRLDILRRDLDHITRARNLLARFQANCSDPKILAQAQTSEAKAHQQAVERAEAAASGQPLR
jgi:hypothetical protein